MSRKKAAAGGTATPMMKQYLRIKKGYPDCILFFRMGDFYEMFMEDAEVAADILKIALTSRDKGKENSVPMCGVPFHAADNYVTRLINAGHKVAICDQVEDPARAKGLVRREVTRIVTPGTTVEDSLLSASEPSYLASIYPDPAGVQYGVALVDVSTGRFILADTGNRESLRLILAQYSPREILLPDGFEPETNGIDLQTGIHLTDIDPYRYHPGVAEEALKEFYGVKSLKGFGLNNESPAMCAAGAALWYLLEVHTGKLSHLRSPRYLSPDNKLILDENALKNLEVLEGLQDGKSGGHLLAVMDRTVTAMGARHFRELLTIPLGDPSAIECRLDLVEELLQEQLLRDNLRGVLKRVWDIERILSRISAGTATPRDLSSLGQTLKVLPEVKEQLGKLGSQLGEDVLSRVDEMEDLYHLLYESIVEDPPLNLKNGGVIRRGYNAALDELWSLAVDGKRFISDLEAREKDRTGITSLKVGFNRVFGYYIEVTNTHREMVPENYIRKQTLVNAERYITEELKNMEEKILTSQERLVSLEKKLFDEIREKVMAFTSVLQQTSTAIADADVFSALAELAHTSGYCRPRILSDDPENRISISDGRHPVLENTEFTDNFVPNDVYLDSDNNRMIILTGPNMAGKSTYMRQVALIVIMAQMGSFVPAKEAMISPVDRIFTRVGASDAISRGLSTFMVEMVETAEILNNATDRSLVILDEIGRGTSTFDGISIAWAVAEHLLNGSPGGCRTIFATHYHELTELTLTNQGVRNYNVAIREWGERLVFLHKVQEGASDKSYGIHVGRLAGLPGEVVKRAGAILDNLEDSALDSDGQPVLVAGKIRRSSHDIQDDVQMGLFSNRSEELAGKLKELDLDTITPVEALNILVDMKKKYE